MILTSNPPRQQDVHAKVSVLGKTGTWGKVARVKRKPRRFVRLHVNVAPETSPVRTRYLFFIYSLCSESQETLLWIIILLISCCLFRSKEDYTRPPRTTTERASRPTRPSRPNTQHNSSTGRLSEFDECNRENQAVKVWWILRLIYLILQVQFWIHWQILVRVDHFDRSKIVSLYFVILI